MVAPTLLGDLTADGQGGGSVAWAVVYGDSAYGTGAHLAWLDQQGLTPMVKTPVPTAPGGRFAEEASTRCAGPAPAASVAGSSPSIPASRGWCA